jgi:hypothetical protein
MRSQTNAYEVDNFRNFIPDDFVAAFRAAPGNGFGRARSKSKYPEGGVIYSRRMVAYEQRRETLAAYGIQSLKNPNILRPKSAGEGN